MGRDTRVLEALGGTIFIVQYRMPTGWARHGEWEDKDLAIAEAKELAERPGHSTANQVIWRSTDG